MNARLWQLRGALLALDVLLLTGFLALGRPPIGLSQTTAAAAHPAQVRQLQGQAAESATSETALAPAQPPKVPQPGDGGAQAEAQPVAYEAEHPEGPSVAGLRATRDASLPPPLPSLEQQLLGQLNKERAARSLAPLSVDQQLVALARRRSQDMVDRDYFTHYLPEGGTVFNIMDRAGIDYHYAGENLARNKAPEDLTVSIAMQALMASPTHRENMLSSDYQRVGIGAQRGHSDWKVFTLLFTGPPP